MLGASFLPARFRRSEAAGHTGKPSWFSRQINPLLLSLSSRACVHPIYTIVSVAVLASTTYLGLLESSLFDRQALGGIGRADFDSLLVGSKRLYTSQEVGWRWLVEDNEHDKVVDDVGSRIPTTPNYSLIDFRTLP
jgi:hydroxymethylglutaryl-CoA reductase (NADPH)